MWIRELSVLALTIAAGASLSATGQSMPPPSGTSVVTGRAYAGEWRANLRDAPPLYTIRLETETSAGVDRLRALSVDPSGRTFLEQTVTYESGVPSGYRLIDRRSNQEGRLTVTPTELVFELTGSGRTRTARTPRPGLFGVGPSIGRLLEQHVRELASFQPLELSMAAVPRLETFQLRIVREDPSEREPVPEVRSGQWMRLKLQPANALYRVFAPVVSLVVDVRSGRTLFVTGPLPAPDGGQLSRGTVIYDQ